MLLRSFLIFFFVLNYLFSWAQFTVYPNFGLSSAHLLDVDTVWTGSNVGIIKMLRDGTVLERWNNAEIDVANITPVQFAKDNQGRILVYYNAGGIRRLESNDWVTITDIFTPTIGLLTFKKMLVDAQNRTLLLGPKMFRQNGQNWDTIPFPLDIITKAKRGPDDKIYITNGKGVIARFNGTNWETTEQSLPGKQFSFDFTFAQNGDLYGAFYAIGSNIPEIWRFPLADFNNPILHATAPTYGYKLTEPNRVLYATSIAIDTEGRVFLNLNGPSYHFIRWNGTTWTRFGGEANCTFLHYFFENVDLSPDADSGIWISSSTNIEGLYRFENTQSFKPYNNSLKSMAWDAATAPDGKIWFCGPSRVGYYDPITRKIEEFELAINADAIQYITISPTNGRVYLGSSEGIQQYDGQNWSLYKPMPSPTTQALHKVVVAADAWVWAGIKSNSTQYALWGTDPNSSNMASYPFSTRINDLEPSPDSSIWGAVGNQIFHFKNGVFEYFDGNTVGYPFNVAGANVTKIELDAVGRLWAFVDNVGLVKLENGDFSIFTPQNSGIQTNINCRALEIEANGNVWLSFYDSPFTAPHSFQIYNGEDWRTISDATANYDFWGVEAMVATSDGKMWFNDGFEFFSYQVYAHWLRGQVLLDANANCFNDTLETPLNQWIVQAANPEGDIFYSKTQANGRYEINLESNVYTVDLLPPSESWGDCDANISVDLTANLADTTDFSGEILAECPLLNLDVSVPHLRRCFPNTYQIKWCNLGTAPAIGASVDLFLPTQLEVTAMSLPFNVISTGHYRVQIGDVALGACGGFSMTVLLDCDAPLGSAVCISASILPDSICLPAPNWSGADLTASATCTTDTTYFTIKNQGTGDMTQSLDYVVIEDEVIMRMDQIQINSGDSVVVPFPISSIFQGIQMPQVQGHPFPGIVSAGVEGCNGQAQTSFLLNYPFDDPSPFQERECAEVVGSFDPNDKAASPIGVKDEHFILPNTQIDYKIRFQNTGNDTAFTVVVRDTLSLWHDVSQFRAGVSSHQYTWDISGQGVLSFTFNNILLPDSTTNLEGSNGFVAFSIKPKIDIPLGTLVENRAGIFFDFNEPVLTNTVWHTVDTGFLNVNMPDIVEEIGEGSGLFIFPNPTDEVIYVGFRNHPDLGNLTNVEIVSVLGETFKEINLSGKITRVDLKELPSGIWFLRDRNGLVGKFVKM
jgi:uncharacterized repeat protein (TIGR01451 family)